MSLKTSTCVLFDPDQTFANFGYDAETQYGELAAEGTDTHKEWYYFRRFKMQLFDNKVYTYEQQPTEHAAKTLVRLGGCFAYIQSRPLVKKL